jgi:Domain of unknown function (DUF4383)
MAKTVATLLGVVFIVVGVVGFFSPSLLGAHLNTAHNVVHLVSGAISLYIGMKGSLSGARQFCIIFGLVYGLLGVVGYFAGTGPDHMLDLKVLMLGTKDHFIHIAIGVLYLIGGFATKSGSSSAA